MIKNIKGITLISLVVTIVVLIILAAVTILLLLNENGLIHRAKEGSSTYQEQMAREKLEMELVNLYVDKEINVNYNQEEYLTQKLREKEFQVDGNIVEVDGWKYEIDRSVPKIIGSLGKSNINIKTKMQKYIGKLENGNYAIQMGIKIENHIPIEKIELQKESGIRENINVSQEQLEVSLPIELKKLYKIIVTGNDGKEYTKNIKVDQIAKINNISTYVGTSYVDIEVDVEMIEGVKLIYHYGVVGKEKNEVDSNTYTIENLEEETNYTVEITIRDETGYYEETIQKEIKTQEKTYLYKNGEEYTTKTGGWKKAFSTYSGTGEKRDSYLYAYSPIHQSVYSTYYHTTANKISLQGYKYMCAEVSFVVHSNGAGGHQALLGLWDGHSYVYYKNTMMISMPKFSGNYIACYHTTSNEIKKVDIQDINEELYLIGGISNGGANDSTSIHIHKVWLEK